MLGSTPVADDRIFLLADHLDGSLAAGEDLLAATLPPIADMAAEDSDSDPVAQFVARLARLEAALVARVLQARRRAAEIPRTDADFRRLVNLFQTATSALLESISQFCGDAQASFETGRDAVAFLRQRRLIAEDAGLVSPYETLRVNETHHVAGCVELGPLLDLISAFLDALDLRYSLYADEDSPERRPEPYAVYAEPAVSAHDQAPLQESEAPVPLTAVALAAALEALERSR